MSKSALSSPHAPAAIGTYSQAVRVGNTLYLSGQIGLNPDDMVLEAGIDAQIERVLKNLQAVAQAGGGSLDDLVKVTVFLTDLTYFGKVNDAMARYFHSPYPARAAVGVASLPRAALVEMDGIMVLHA